MKLSTLCLSLFLICCSSTLRAQQRDIVRSLQQNVSGQQGKVTIYQDPKIESLLGSRLVTAEGGTVQIKMNGYRVQVYAGGNSRAAKEEADRVATQVKSNFPELTVYKSFSPPRWLCRVGDFRSIEEADAMMRKLKSTGGFREVSIVKDQITISL